MHRLERALGVSAWAADDGDDDAVVDDIGHGGGGGDAAGSLLSITPRRLPRDAVTAAVAEAFASGGGGGGRADQRRARQQQQEALRLARPKRQASPDRVFADLPQPFLRSSLPAGFSVPTPREARSPSPGGAARASWSPTGRARRARAGTPASPPIAVTGGSMRMLRRSRSPHALRSASPARHVDADLSAGPTVVVATAAVATASSPARTALRVHARAAVGDSRPASRASAARDDARRSPASGDVGVLLGRAFGAGSPGREQSTTPASPSQPAAHAHAHAHVRAPLAPLFRMPPSASLSIPLDGMLPDRRLRTVIWSYSSPVVTGAHVRRFLFRSSVSAALAVVVAVLYNGLEREKLWKEQPGAIPPPHRPFLRRRSSDFDPAVMEPVLAQRAADLSRGSGIGGSAASSSST